MSNEPDPIRLFVARVPMVFGSMMMTYAPITLATSRGACWDKTVEWADGCCGNAVLFRQAYRQAADAPSQVEYHLSQWGLYKVDAPRAKKIAWLKRRDVSVVGGYFFDDKEYGREEAS